MHYHLLLTDERGDFVDIRTLQTADEADRHARLLLSGRGEWSPNRYPGRSWKRGEIAVYLDRAHPTHRKLCILRCPADDPVDLACLLRSFGVPALNLGQAAAEDTGADGSPPEMPGADASPPEVHPPRAVRAGR